MNKFKNLLAFFAQEFLPLLAFYGVNHYYGLKPAIVVSIIVTVGEIIYRKRTGKAITPLFVYSVTAALVFGALDLYLSAPTFIKYEAALSNILTGVFFGLSLRTGHKPICQEFAEKKWEKNGQSFELTEDRLYFLWFLTGVWTFYFFAKASFYLWVAGRYSLEEALAIRSVVGNVSLYTLMFVSLSFPKQIRAVLASLQLLPSSRQ